MAKEVKVTVTRDGRVATELSGFLGDDCYDEAERLAEVLKRLGLYLDLKGSTAKTRLQMEAESGTAATGGKTAVPEGRS